MQHCYGPRSSGSGVFDWMDLDPVKYYRQKSELFILGDVILKVVKLDYIIP
jgi:hypothetical protein